MVVEMLASKRAVITYFEDGKMEHRKIKQYLAIILIVWVCQTGFSKDAEMPRITVQVDNLVKESFNDSMQKVPENPVNDITSIDMGFSILGPIGVCVDGSYMIFKNINNLVSIPLFAAGGIGFTGGSLYAGSGIIFKNRYFDLGLMAGLYIGTLRVDGTKRYDAERENTTKFDYGIFPILNTAEFPWLSFIEKIYGFLYNNEPDVSDKKFDSFNFLLNVVFKRFSRLSVLELYTYKGVNDFFPGYDLSNYTMKIGNAALYNITTHENYDLGGNGAYVDGGSDANVYKTLTYGLRIGGDNFMVDINYLTVSDLVVDYKYPYSLNGFPSVTLNFSLSKLFEIGPSEGKIGWFLRFSTLNQTGQPYLPDIGLYSKSDEVAVYCTWTLPAYFSISARFCIPN
jgi:hypothetical protein